MIDKGASKWQMTMIKNNDPANDSTGNNDSEDTDT